jgi:hypothetical protein
MGATGIRIIAESSLLSVCLGAKAEEARVEKWMERQAHVLDMTMGLVADTAGSRSFGTYACRYS